ncbi:hypothetical protein GJ496_011213, partial [Pomphorhynchus laevis]
TCQSCHQQIHRNAPICPICKAKTRSRFNKIFRVEMIKSNQPTNENLQKVLFITRKVVQWCFVPFVIYNGFKLGPDPGQPEFSLWNLLWS